VLSAIVLGFFGLQASNRANEAMATFRENLENSPFGALAGDFVGTVEFGEGWVVMAIGIVISAAGSLAAKRPEPKD
jgi:hypothetical protein